MSELETEASACESLRTANDALREEVDTLKTTLAASVDQKQELRDRVSALKMEMTDSTAALAAKVCICSVIRIDKCVTLRVMQTTHT